MNAYKRLSQLIRFNYKEFSSDASLTQNLSEELSHRDKEYTELLENYVNLTQKRGNLKEIHKWVFFWLIIFASAIILVMVFMLLKRILSSSNDSVIIRTLPASITALVSFVATIIAVPATITKFLFNTNEDDNIIKLITHTQEHDAAGRSLLISLNKSSNRPNAKLIDKNTESTINIEADDSEIDISTIDSDL